MIFIVAVMEYNVLVDVIINSKTDINKEAFCMSYSNGARADRGTNVNIS